MGGRSAAVRRRGGISRGLILPSWRRKVSRELAPPQPAATTRRASWAHDPALILGACSTDGRVARLRGGGAVQVVAPCLAPSGGERMAVYSDGHEPPQPARDPGPSPTARPAAQPARHAQSACSTTPAERGGPARRVGRADRRRDVRGRDRALAEARRIDPDGHDGRRGGARGTCSSPHRDELLHVVSIHDAAQAEGRVSVLVVGTDAFVAPRGPPPAPTGCRTCRSRSRQIRSGGCGGVFFFFFFLFGCVRASRHRGRGDSALTANRRRRR